eukprot:11207031-Lingulodinium_polyedra.AAC.1
MRPHIQGNDHLRPIQCQYTRCQSLRRLLPRASRLSCTAQARAIIGGVACASWPDVCANCDVAPSWH